MIRSQKVHTEPTERDVAALPHQAMQSSAEKQLACNGENAVARTTIWGLTPRQLHDAYWSAHGVQCLRQGENVAIDRTADLYLLLRPQQLVLFNLRTIIDRLVWRGSYATHVRLTPDATDVLSYQEQIRIDSCGLVERIERQYEPGQITSQRVMIVQRPRLAELWPNAITPRDGWKSIHRAIPLSKVDRFSQSGYWFREDNEESEHRLLDVLVRQWTNPQCSIRGIQEAKSGIWVAENKPPPEGVTLVGPLWIGLGSVPEDDECIVGPAWRGDAPKCNSPNAAKVQVLDMLDIEAPDERARLPRHQSQLLYPIAKRGFDVIVSAAVLIAAFPLLLIIALAIVMESGRPVIFSHERQSRWGKPFRCLKFRTMHLNAENMVSQLDDRNQCDGPQVNIEDDPRVTRVGHHLRRFNLDELPQFWNVLKGEMSVVGPRPSPEAENRYCPAWRELRLSVRPGITGLWQLERTRTPGRDFYEWIRYDIEYVRTANFWYDLSICLRTARIMILGRPSDD